MIKKKVQETIVLLKKVKKIDNQVKPWLIW
jgi:hypothetical protein